MKSVLLGPFIGDFAQEVLTFRPYVNYVKETLENDDVKVYISSHRNRSFFYDWIEPDRFIPVYDHISRDEPSQTGFTFSGISKAEFNQIVNQIKTNIGKADIYSLPYVRNVNKISIFQKIFTKFEIPEMEVDIGDADILFIPNKSDKSYDMFKEMSKSFNVTVIGDMNNGIEDENIILKDAIFNDRYIKMFNMIKKPTIVVTNCPEWVVICNIQGLPVMYWGNDASLYKHGNVLNFDNNLCTSLCDMDVDSLVQMLKYGLKR